MDLSTRFAVGNDSFYLMPLLKQVAAVLYFIDGSGLSGAPTIALGVHIFGVESYRKFASD